MRIRTWFAAAGLLVLIAALAAPPAQAQYFGRNKVQYDDFNFKTLETEHFVFHFYPEEERAVRDAARMAERWYDRHTEVFLHRFDETSSRPTSPTSRSGRGREDLPKRCASAW